VIFAAILFGALRNGSDLMQLRSGGVVSKEIIFIVQAVILCSLLPLRSFAGCIASSFAKQP
jgi:ABC-type uncharacterized transport system permease subunit